MSRLISARTRTMVRTRTEQAMTATVRVLRGGLGTLDPGTGSVAGLTDTTTVYGGEGGAKARVRTLRSSVVAVGDGVLSIRRAVVSIPIDSALPHVDDLLLVIAGDDQDLNTRAFRVTGVEAGGLFGDARRMEVEGWYQSRYWGQQ